MNILALADSHANSRSDIPRFLTEMTGSLDLIIHAGDITGDDYLMGLEAIAPVAGVRGNMDSGFLTSKLPEKTQLKYLGWSFGVIHGHGAPEDVPAYARSQFSRLDLIVFGHSHIPILEVSRDVVLLNPGSLSSPRSSNAGSYAIIKITEMELECRILTIPQSGNEEIARHIIRRSL